MVGDNLLTDIAFGHRAKFTTVLVESGAHTQQDVKRLCDSSSRGEISPGTTAAAVVG